MGLHRQKIYCWTKDSNKAVWSITQHRVAFPETQDCWFSIQYNYQMKPNKTANSYIQGSDSSNVYCFTRKIYVVCKLTFNVLLLSVPAQETETLWKRKWERHCIGPTDIDLIISQRVPDEVELETLQGLRELLNSHRVVWREKSTACYMSASPSYRRGGPHCSLAAKWTSSTVQEQFRSSKDCHPTRNHPSEYCCMNLRWVI